MQIRYLLISMQIRYLLIQKKKSQMLVNETKQSGNETQKAVQYKCKLTKRIIYKFVRFCNQKRKYS